MQPRWCCYARRVALRYYANMAISGERRLRGAVLQQQEEGGPPSFGHIIVKPCVADLMDHRRCRTQENKALRAQLETAQHAREVAESKLLVRTSSPSTSCCDAKRFLCQTFVVLAPFACRSLPRHVR